MRLAKKIRPERKEADLINILKLFSPGTAVRTALDDIHRAKMGALIIIDKEGLFNIVEGGFRINCKFSAQRLVELAKMDGAIVLSGDLKRILYVNALLVPTIKIKTKETGTRHKAAERSSKQIGTVAIAVSERKNKITLYWRGERYVLESSSEVLRRATETLQILEKQKDSLDDSLLNFNVLEITNVVTTNDVCDILQKMEIIRRISEIIKRYLVELGRDGITISMRLKELMKNFNRERAMILEDYFISKFLKAESSLNEMDFDSLLELSNIAESLFEHIHDKSISPKGVRILSKAGLTETFIFSLTNHFGSLDRIFSTDKNSLIDIFGSEDIADSIAANLRNLKEKILAGKSV